MDKRVERPEDLDREEMARLLIDLFHRIIVHYTLWFTEVERRMGPSRALETMGEAFKKSYEIQMRRLGKGLGFEMIGSLPRPLLKMSKESLLTLVDHVALNWLANDGVWFQAVESRSGMSEAKHCNDSCWMRFSPFEAWSIRQFLGLPENPGLEGLKRALQFRIYARINVQSIVDEAPNSLVFRMNDCRVQSARLRKGLQDYPCKSGGMVEYSTFAQAIDPGIRTECIACPPDNHPQAWWCAWRFTIPEQP